MERQRKLGGLVDQLVTTRLMHQIVSIGGVSDRAALAKMIKQMPARDSRELRKHMEEVTPGVTMRQDFDCPRCGAKEEVTVPMGTEFFWPEV